MTITTAQIEEGIRRAKEQGDIEGALMLADALEERTTYGAPNSVRMAVGNARSRQDKLATLQQWYPDARDTGDNFVYTDQEGNRTVYNEPGFDFGDLAEFSRVAPETAGAAIGGVLGLPGGLAGSAIGASIGGAIGGQINDWLSPHVDTRNQIQRAQDVALDLVANAAPGPTPMPVADRVVANAERIRKRQLDRAAKDIGARLSVAQRTGSETADRLENYAEGTLFGGGIIRDQRLAAADAVGEYGARAMPDAPMSPQATGQLMREAIGDSVARLERRESQLWNQVERSFADEGNSIYSQIPIPSLQRAIDDIQRVATEGNPYAPLVADPNVTKLSNILDEVVENPSYELVKQYRTRLGETMKNPLLQSQGTSQSHLKRLYGAASRDLTAGAQELGGEAGEAAREAANTFTREMQAQFKPWDKALAGTDAEAFQRLERNFYRNPQAFAQTLAGVNNPNMARIQPNYQNREAIMSELFRRMGLARPGAQDASGDLFSPTTFLTNFNKIQREAPQNMLQFTAEQRKAVQNIVRVAEALKLAERNINKSRTALVSQTGTLAAGVGAFMMGSPVAGGAALASAAVPALLARVMTNDSLAKQLASSHFDVARLLQETIQRAAGPAGMEYLKENESALTLDDITGVIAP